MNVAPRLIGLLLLLAGGVPAYSQPDATAVIQLQAETVEALRPLLQPLVAPEGWLGGSGHRLLVRAPAARLRALREALAALDHPPRRLLLQLRRVHARQGRGLVAHTRGRGALLEQVQALEGRPARLLSGRLLTVHRPLLLWGGDYPGAADRIDRRPQLDLLVATPRVVGDQVLLAIEFRSRRPDAAGTGSRLQGAETTLRGPLGSWLPLAATSARGASPRRGSGFHAATGGAEEWRLEVRVLPLD